jgi:Aldehyde dehydrogenase family
MRGVVSEWGVAGPPKHLATGVVTTSFRSQIVAKERAAMETITTHYIDGAFVESHGHEAMDIISPTDGQVIGRVTLADEEDTRRAIAAAKRAFATYGRSTKEERAKILRRLHDAVTAHIDDLTDAMVEEYGGTVTFSRLMMEAAANVFLSAEKALQELPLTRSWNKTTVTLEPAGVAGLITPWNANSFFLSAKLASAVAAGCTVVIKPSELSALQTRAWLSCLDEAKLPKGVCNLVIGRGDVVGAEIVRDPDVAKISFTGSVAVGKSIMRDGAATMKRVTLELGGKSPNILLDDADLSKTIPTTLAIAFMNSGQACVAGDAAARAEESAGRGEAGHQGSDSRVSGRRSVRSKNRNRADGDPKAVRSRAILHPQGHRRRRRGAGRRRGSPGRPRRLLREAHCIRQCEQRHVDRPGKRFLARSSALSLTTTTKMQSGSPTKRALACTPT